MIMYDMIVLLRLKLFSGLQLSQKTRTEGEIFLNTIINEKFTMESSACYCVIDTVHDDDGTEKATLRIRALPDKKLLFAYVPGDGLVTLNQHTGAVDQENILGKFAGIKSGDQKALVSFFNQYGFLFPISHERLESFSFEVLFAIQKRVSVTLDLMGMLQETRVPYIKIMSAVCWLTLADRIEINPSDDGSEPFRTCAHSYTEFLHKQVQGQYDSLAVDPYVQNEIDVSDSIYPPTVKISLTGLENDALLVESKTHPPFLSKYAATVVYTSEMGHMDSDRIVIDYFYHLAQEMGEITSVGSEPSELRFAGIERPLSEKLTPAMRKATLDVAKIIIKEEMDYAVNAIYPSYDTKTMSASWRIPDLYSALFFSIFYMRPETELYRRCENPSCGVYFLVATTNSRRKYCSPACSNAMQQRKIRARKKKASASDADAEG